jgi:hypothetical protein
MADHPPEVHQDYHVNPSDALPLQPPPVLTPYRPRTLRRIPHAQPLPPLHTHDRLHQPQCRPLKLRFRAHDRVRGACVSEKLDLFDNNEGLQMKSSSASRVQTCATRVSETLCTTANSSLSCWFGISRSLGLSAAAASRGARYPGCA